MTRYVQRYRDFTRINHWLVAFLFIGAGLTGLAFLHPAFYFFTALFGGGPWARILHPFFGVLMALGFIFLFFQLWRDNIWNRDDSAWVRNAPRMMRGDEEHTPPAGKYNAGQKLVFWIFALCLVLLVVTGIMFWRPWFADAFPIPVRRVAVLLHSVSAAVLIIGVIIHIYAAIWVKGSVRAMTRGTVSEHWARQHHPKWYRQLEGKE